jgi:hypothetical protein
MIRMMVNHIIDDDDLDLGMAFNFRRLLMCMWIER